MNPGPLQTPEHMNSERARLNALGWYHSIQLPSGVVICGLQTVDQLRERLRQYPIPEDLHGYRVLDIGAWDGWFSFEMERRGASVVAVDLVRNERLLWARNQLGSKVEYLVSSVYDLTPDKLGTFDIVLFFGVLYHLKHPLLALERVCALATQMVCVESFVSNCGALGGSPILEFYEGTELCGQFDNWVGPNVAALMAMCRAAGMARVTFHSILGGDRAHVTGYRAWNTPVGYEPAPRVTCVENATSRDQNLRVDADDYLSIWFTAHTEALSKAEVFVEIGGYAAPPVLVENAGRNGWQTVVKLCPGLVPGWHPVRLRLSDSRWSNRVELGVDVTESDRSARMIPGVPQTVLIETVADGKTWERNQVVMRKEACVSAWIRGLSDSAGIDDVVLRLSGFDVPIVYLSEPAEGGLRQVNAMLPSGLSEGEAQLAVVAEGVVSSAVPLRITLPVGTFHS